MAKSRRRMDAVSLWPDPWRDELLDFQSAREEISAARQRVAEYNTRLDQLDAAVQKALKRRYENHAKRNGPPPQESESAAD